MNKDTIKINKGLIQKLKNIRILLMDVDGVLTDGSIILGAGDQEFKKFDVQDGMGITLARMGGLKVGILTGRQSEAVEKRAKELRVDMLYQGNSNKLVSYLDIVKKDNIPENTICFIGDDLLDLSVLRRVGMGVAVANAREEVKKEADYITEKSGGKGAVREVVELILKAQEKWQSVIENVYENAV